MTNPKRFSDRQETKKFAPFDSRDEAAPAVANNFRLDESAAKQTNFLECVAHKRKRRLLPTNTNLHFACNKRHRIVILVEPNQFEFYANSSHNNAKLTLCT